MRHFSFKLAISSTILASSAFASGVVMEDAEKEQTLITTQSPGFSGGHFHHLPKEMLVHLGSVMPVLRLEEAQELVTVCKFFHAYVVPQFFFSWTPKHSNIPMESPFVSGYASRFVLLDLSFNPTFGHEQLHLFSNLEDLDLRSNRIIADKSVGRLTKLRHLSLCRNEQITDACLFNLTNLTYLDLGGNNIISNEAITGLTKLTHLNLWCNDKITDEPILKLPNLMCINLYGNNTIGSEAIKKISSLRKLILSNNSSIKDDAVSVLTNLTELSLHNNNTITIAGYSHLSSLTEVSGRD